MRRASPILLALTGCGVTFPNESMIEDLRILELRTSPPEIRVFEEVRVDAEAGELASLTPNFDPITLTAVVAHPDLDATFDVEWIRCVGSTGAAFQRVPCSGEFKARLGTGTSTAVSPVKLAYESFSLDSAGGVAEAITSLASDPRDLFSGLRLFFNAQATVTGAAIDADTARLEGTKRLIVFDPTIVALALREARLRGPDAIPTVAGLDLPTLCTNVTSEAFATIVEYLRTRPANRAPRYASIEYLTPTATATVTYSSTTTIEVRPNEPILLRGRVDETDIERYRSIDNKCRLVDFTETMSWSWFTNVGTISDRVTSEGEVPDEDELETVWRAPPASELDQEETRVRIWSVLRDGRGGSDSRTVDLVISKSR